MRLEAGKLYCCCTHDTPRNIVLDTENIFDLGIVHLRPDVSSRRSLGQLGVDTNTVAGAANAAAQEIASVEPTADLGRCQLWPLN